MTEINEAMNALKNTEWFEKLSRINEYKDMITRQLERDLINNLR